MPVKRVVVDLETYYGIERRIIVYPDSIENQTRASGRKKWRNGQGSISWFVEDLSKIAQAIFELLDKKEREKICQKIK